MVRLLSRKPWRQSKWKSSPTAKVYFSAAVCAHLLYADGQATPRWHLEVRLSEERRSFSIGLDETASRARVRLAAHWTLTPLANQTNSFAAQTRTSFAYDIVSSAYATEIAEEAARDAALEELAERLVRDLSVASQPHPGRLMEIKPQTLASFLNAAPPAATLFYGANRGLVRESAMRLVAQALGTAKISDSPFGLSRFTAEQITSGAVVLDDAARAVSFDMALGGGSRVLWLEGEGEKCASQLQRYLLALQSEGDSPPPAILIVEAGALRKNHKLVTAFAKNTCAAVAACYPDEGRIQDGLIAEYFSASRLPVEVRRELVARLSPDRMLARRELEKLALLAGSQDAITAEQVFLAVADNAESDFDDLCFAITAGQVKRYTSPLPVSQKGARMQWQLRGLSRVISCGFLKLSPLLPKAQKKRLHSAAYRRLSFGNAKPPFAPPVKTALRQA